MLNWRKQGHSQAVFYLSGNSVAHEVWENVGHRWSGFWSARRSSRTKAVLKRSHIPELQPKIYLGATGWGNKEWLGTWYPDKAKPKEFLKHYSQQFNTIEFNTTHYRIPAPETIDRWFELAGKGFRFCPKVPQQISHRARLRAPEATERFVSTIAGLGYKLGPSFIQLPDAHHPGAVNQVLDFVRNWPGQDAPQSGLHWELRHPGWFEATGGPAGEAFDIMESHGHGTVITDVAGRRDVLHMQLTNPVLVLRFVGNGLHPTDYVRTGDWVTRIAKWCEMGLHEAYIFIHQPEMEIVPEFTAYWAKALQEACGVEVLAPEPIRKDIQGTLF